MISVLSVCVCVLYIFRAFCGLAIRRGKKTAKFTLKKSEKVRSWWCSSISFFWFQSNEFGKISELRDSHNNFVAIWGDTVDGQNPAPGDMVNVPLFSRVLYIPGGAGFLPSTASVIWTEERTTQV